MRYAPDASEIAELPESGRHVPRRDRGAGDGWPAFLENAPGDRAGASLRRCARRDRSAEDRHESAASRRRQDLRRRS